MSESTKEQIKFWEWCGFKWEERAIVRLAGAPFDSMGGWSYPNSIVHGVLPSLDLNNLFKYAVPKVAGIVPKLDLLNTWIIRVVRNDEDPALALYQALCKIKEATDEG